VINKKKKKDKVVVVDKKKKKDKVVVVDKKKKKDKVVVDKKKKSKIPANDNINMADGYFEVDPTNKNIIHDEVQELQTKLEKLKIPKTIKLNIPETVSVSLEITIDKDKKLIIGTSRVLEKKETIEKAHQKLYSICLKSLLKLTSSI